MVVSDPQIKQYNLSKHYKRINYTLNKYPPSCKADIMSPAGFEMR